MLFRAFFVASALLLSSSACSSQSPATMDVIVHANGRGEMLPSSFRVEYAGKELPVSRVAQLGGDEGAPVEIAILLDQSVRATVQPNWAALRAFVSSLPSVRTAVGVGYMREGHVALPAGFTTKPERALQALEAIPAGQQTGQTLLSASEIARSWPIHPGAARVLLLLTTGLDVNEFRSNGRQPEDVVAPVVAAAQRASIPIYSINCSRGNYAYPYLAALADGTGGEALDGMIAWTSLEMFLSAFKADIANSYLVQLEGGSPNLSKLKVTSTISGIKLRTQKQAAAR